MSARIPFSVEELDKIARGELRIADLARARAISTNTIRKALRAAGLVSPYYRNLPEEEIAARYLAGESTPQLARAFQTSGESIRQVLLKKGTPTRSRSEASRLARK